MKRSFIKAALTLSVLTITFAVASGAAQAATNSSDTLAAVRLTTAKENYLAVQRLKALKANEAASRIDAASPSVWLTRVNRAEVNMVTNRFQKAVQEPVNLNGKAYYVAGSWYSSTLSNNPSIRFAKDPFTSRVVDKAEAVIFADAAGRAYYFESEDTYKGFIGLAGRTSTVAAVGTPAEVR